MTIKIFSVLVFLSILAGAFYLLSADNSYSRDISIIETSIINDLREYVAVIDGARNLIVNNGSLPPEDWRKYFEIIGLEETYLGLSTVAYSELVHNSEVSSYERGLREVYKDSSLEIYPRSENEKIVLKLIYPLSESTRRAIGLDVATSPQQITAIRLAIDSGLPTISKKSQFRVTGHSGFSILEPIFRSGFPIATTEDRRVAFLGVVGASFHSKDFFEEAMNDVHSDLRVRIYDGDASTEENLLHDTDPDSGVFVSDGSKEVRFLNASWIISYQYHKPDAK